MKAPAFIASALGALGAAGGKLGSVFIGAAGAAKRAAGSIAGGAGRVASGIDRKTLRYVGLGVAALSGAIVVAILLGVVITGASAARDRKAAETAVVSEAQSAGANDSAVPKSGPGLASMLLIPGEDEWPWPLALEPKERYTEADAAAVRPDMSEVDVSDLTRRRKAELEAIYGAVD